MWHIRREENCMQSFGGRNLKERDNLDLQEIGWEGVDSDGLL
jgi:hypothetical protein